MKTFTVITALVGLAAAMPHPWTIINKRALTEKDLDERTGCPRELPVGQFEFPHYITQVSKKLPNKAYGPQYNGVFTPNDIASIFSFDIPASRTDANCTLEFIFPKLNQLTTSSFSYSGGGSFFMKGYNPGSCPNATTTYNHQPEAGPFPPFPAIHMEPGNAYTIDIGPCFVSAGKCAAGMTYTNDTSFNFFQDSGACPIGYYTSYSYGLPPSKESA